MTRVSTDDRQAEAHLHELDTSLLRTPRRHQTEGLSYIAKSLSNVVPFVIDVLQHRMPSFCRGTWRQLAIGESLVVLDRWLTIRCYLVELAYY